MVAEAFGKGALTAKVKHPWLPSKSVEVPYQSIQKFLN